VQAFLSVSFRPASFSDTQADDQASLSRLALAEFVAMSTTSNPVMVFVEAVDVHASCLPRSSVPFVLFQPASPSPARQPPFLISSPVRRSSQPPCARRGLFRFPVFVWLLSSSVRFASLFILFSFALIARICSKRCCVAHPRFCFTVYPSQLFQIPYFSFPAQHVLVCYYAVVFTSALTLLSPADGRFSQQILAVNAFSTGS
jgi:hypothetical protein